MTGWGGPAAAVGAAVLLVAGPPASGPRRVRRLGPGAVTHGEGASPLGLRRFLDRFAPVGRAALATAAGVRRRFGRPADVVLDRRLVASVVVGLVAGLWHPVSGIVAASALWVGLRARHRSAARRRGRDLVDEVPDLVELFRLSVDAGLTVHLAVNAVSSRFGGVTGEALHRVRSRVARGERLADALDALAGCGEPVRPLATLLVAAERYGDPLAPALERLSVEARMVRRRDAEEAARRLPVQLLFPLVLCVLPAFVLLAVAPLLIAAVPQLPH